MIRSISILFFIGLVNNLFAEGTKQLRPTSADFGNVEINDQYRPFALESNTDSLHRLYIHVKSTSEKIYFGFQPQNKTLGTGTFRIKDASGTVVYARTSVPVATGAGYIENYAEAVAGPKIGGSPAGGYNPLSFSPATTGDFYIEFTTTLGAGTTYHFDLFDITVVDVSNQPINGRLWSYAWDFSTQGGNNQFNSTMYVYTADKYTTSIFFNGMQPYGFVVSCNSKGTRNTGNEAIDRKSLKDTNATYPEFKVFLSIPDPTVYTAATIPTMIEDLSVIGSPITGSPVKFFLNMNKAGTIEIFLDLDGVSGYQAGNKDVVLVDVINAGGDTLIWDGKDAQGTFVISNVTVGVSSKFATGVTHFPIYDDEYSPNGIIVNRISPNASRAAVYWDDSNIPSGTINLTGASGNTNGHNYPVVTNGFGNLHTINTWWNGYENNDLKSFTFTMDGSFLPICLKNFTSKINESSIQLSWQTASETNNDYFEIQRSADAIKWVTITQIDGAGNSTKTINYNYSDISPIIGISYYRIEQIDFDGKSTLSKAISVNFKETILSEVSTYPNPAINSITVDLGENNNTIIEILSLDGRNVTKQLSIIKLNNTSYSIDISSLEKGAYIISINGDANLFMKQ
jgi:hypothetical protein